MNPKITLTRRMNDYQANLYGKPECWEASSEAVDTIAKLIFTFPWQFGLKRDDLHNISTEAIIRLVGPIIIEFKVF